MESITEHQLASSTSATVGSHDNFLSSSDTQASILLDLCALVRSRLDQLQVMDQRCTAPRATLSSLDKELDSLNRSLMSCRNACVPISALPPELLARIFRFFALEAPSWVSNYRRGLGWIVVTHVCRRWRHVALDDSTLWALISGIPRSTKWLSEILVRARNTPLVFDHVLILKREILTRLLPFISRTRELRLHSSSLCLSGPIQDICESEAPELEHFELGIPTTPSVTFLQLSGKTLFKGRIQKLRTISLSQVFIPWPLLPRGQLTQLRVMLYSEISIPDPSSPVNLDQLVELLINSPGLEVIVLELCSSTTPSRPSHGQRIHLPRLSRLHLKGPTSCVTNLFERFMIPSSASLQLHCIPEDHSTLSDHLILPLVSAAHFHRGSVEFKSLKVTANCADRIVVVASILPPKSIIYDQRIVGGDMDSEAEFTLSFDRLTKFDPSIQPDILVQACSILPTSNIEFLSISVHGSMQPMNWYELFSHCKNITTIQAKGRGTCGLLQVLAPPKPVNASSCSEREMKCDNRLGATHAQVRATNSTGGFLATATNATVTPFPNMTCLLLEGLSFNPPIPYFRDLEDALRWRKMNGSLVKTLSMDCCIITSSRANRLKEYVQEFRWDEDEGLVGEEDLVGIPFTKYHVALAKIRRKHQCYDGPF